MKTTAPKPSNSRAYQPAPSPPRNASEAWAMRTASSTFAPKSLSNRLVMPMEWRPLLADRINGTAQCRRRARSEPCGLLARPSSLWLTEQLAQDCFDDGQQQHYQHDRQPELQTAPVSLDDGTQRQIGRPGDDVCRVPQRPNLGGRNFIQ